MRFLFEMMSSVIFAIYLLLLLGAAIVTYYMLSSRGLEGWVPWAGALGVIVVLGAPYIFWPRGHKTGRPDDRS